jgi:lipopolysaccharide transport system ATP-binding protein
VLLVSHNLTAIGESCGEVIVLSRGRSVYQGPTPEGLAAYADLIRRTDATKAAVGAGKDGIGERVITRGAEIVEVRLLGREGQPVKVVAPGEHVALVAAIEFREDAPGPHFSCFVRDQRGQIIYDQTTLWQGTATPSYREGERATVAFGLQMNVVDGIYQIGIDLHYHDLTCYYDRLETAATVVVHGGDGAKGTADLGCRFRFPGGADDSGTQSPGLRPVADVAIAI